MWICCVVDVIVRCWIVCMSLGLALHLPLLVLYLFSSLGILLWFIRIPIICAPTIIGALASHTYPGVNSNRYLVRYKGFISEVSYVYLWELGRGFGMEFPLTLYPVPFGV